MSREEKERVRSAIEGAESVEEVRWSPFQVVSGRGADTCVQIRRLQRMLAQGFVYVLSLSYLFVGEELMCVCAGRRRRTSRTCNGRTREEMRCRRISWPCREGGKLDGGSVIETRRGSAKVLV